MREKNKTMSRFIFSTCIILLLFNYSTVAKTTRNENYLTFSTAVFDILQKDNTSFECRLEYRMNKQTWDVKPFSGIMANSDGAFLLYSGIFFEISITSFLSLLPSFAPGIYSKGESKNLHFFLEFRSQVEFAFKMDNDFRIGFSFNHVSNASLGRVNPGVESFAMTYYIPL